jgi:ATP-dependent Lon protease
MSNKQKIETKAYPMAAIREGVMFPHVESVLTFGRKKSIAAVEDAFNGEKLIVLVSQKKSSISDPKTEDLYKIGILAKVERTLKSNGEVNALVVGVTRVRIEYINASGPYLISVVTPIPDRIVEGPEIKALSTHLLNGFKKAVGLGKSVEFLNFMKMMSGISPAELSDQVASALDLPTNEKQKILEATSVLERMKIIIDHLNHEIKVLEIEKSIASKTQKKFDQSMKEAVLRERMKQIQKELGEEDGEEQDVKEFKKKLDKIKMPKEAKKKVDKELKRFSNLSSHNPEHSYIRTWLETVIDIPWSERTDDNVSIRNAQKILDKEHHGLEEVKERIEEFIAVMQLKKNAKKLKDRHVPTILCFVGPPGVGKTSIGKSIAKSMNREFVKVSLGGMRDEAEIRGHRRTYVGAMPGRIIQGMIDAGTKNPVFMLDEIDKVGSDFRGDPSSALLEALDPEQNNGFSDHYLDLPYDLSEVVFITTANVLDTIPSALRDRLEIIEFTGYTIDEKYQIARKYLVPKTLKSNGLKKSQFKISAATLKQLIVEYTREAGVRNLERQISKVMRKAAKRIASNKADSVVVNKRNISKYLGPREYSETIKEKMDTIGLATGMAWTQVGGDILFVEVAIMPGKGNIVLTGKLGDVMQESAKAAWSYVRSSWEKLGLSEGFYKKIDVHVHVPEGAVPKDGPSAGVTITTALVSALTKKPSKRDISMTGEITLRGRVLSIGGVKEKVIAAHRAGIKKVIMPKDNEKDLVKIPESVRDDIEFLFAEDVAEVLDWVLVK